MNNATTCSICGKSKKESFLLLCNHMVCSSCKGRIPEANENDDISHLEPCLREMDDLAKLPLSRVDLAEQFSRAVTTLFRSLSPHDDISSAIMTSTNCRHAFNLLLASYLIELFPDSSSAQSQQMRGAMAVFLGWPVDASGHPKSHPLIRRCSCTSAMKANHELNALIPHVEYINNIPLVNRLVPLSKEHLSPGVPLTDAEDVPHSSTSRQNPRIAPPGTPSLAEYEAGLVSWTPTPGPSKDTDLPPSSPHVHNSPAKGKRTEREHDTPSLGLGFPKPVLWDDYLTSQSSTSSPSGFTKRDLIELEESIDECYGEATQGNTLEPEIQSGMFHRYGGGYIREEARTLLAQMKDVDDDEPLSTNQASNYETLASHIAQVFEHFKSKLAQHASARHVAPTPPRRNTEPTIRPHGESSTQIPVIPRPLQRPGSRLAFQRAAFINGANPNGPYLGPPRYTPVMYQGHIVYLAGPPQFY